MFFGGAIDEAITELLKGNQNYLQVFFDRCYEAKNFYKKTLIFDNPNIAYSNYDFDGSLLLPTDLQILDKWVSELNLSYLDPDGLKCFQKVKTNKTNPYKTLYPDELKYFNRASWLSLNRKGQILIEAFKEQFLPKVKKVHSLQQWASWVDPVTNDSLGGIIDMVLEVEGYDKPIIFDLKTSARPYTSENIELSDQLTTYALMKSAQYNTNLVGYVVLCKNIPKVTVNTCNKCGFIKQGKHKTCNIMVADSSGKLSRCSGTWLEVKTPNPQIQVFVEEKDHQEVDSCLLDIKNIISGMKNNIVYRNRGKCYNWYGGKCPYFNACHKNDLTGLVK